MNIGSTWTMLEHYFPFRILTACQNSSPRITMSIFLRGLIAFAIWGNSNLAHATMTDPDCIELLGFKGSNPAYRFASSAELELTSYPELLAHMRPPSDKIEWLLFDVKDSSDDLELVRLLLPEGHKLKTVKLARWPKILWSKLSPKERIELISSISQVTGFFNKREITGLYFNSRYFKDLGDESTQNVIIFPAVEQMAPYLRSENFGFEFHISSEEKKYDIENVMQPFRLSRQILKKTPRVPKSTHFHLLVSEAPTPVSALDLIVAEDEKKSRISLLKFQPNHLANSALMGPELESLIRTSYAHILTSLYFDFFMIDREREFDLEKNASGASIFQFGPIRPVELERFYLAAQSGHEGLSRQDLRDAPKSMIKSGTVGLRYKGWYRDQLAWGLEFRYLPKSVSDELLDGMIVDTMASLQEGRLAPSNSFMVHLVHESRLNGNPNFAGWRFNPTPIMKMYYQTYTVQRRHLFKLISQNGFAYSERHAKTLEDEIKKNDFVKMLIFDWQQIGDFFRHEDIIKIKRAQAVAIEMLVKGSPSTIVMKWFIKKSGVAYKVRSLFSKKP